MPDGENTEKKNMPPPDAPPCHFHMTGGAVTPCQEKALRALHTTPALGETQKGERCLDSSSALRSLSGPSGRKVYAAGVLPIRSGQSRRRGQGHVWCKCEMNPMRYQRRFKGTGNRDPEELRGVVVKLSLNTEF